MSPTIPQEFGMVNPPRKAKRLRELALKEGPSTGMDFQLSNAHSAPTEVASASSSASVPPAPRRRGRKPAGSLSKSAREQLRKTNHSVIEKRRREKINDALAALRQLVPNEKGTGDKEKKEKEEKEFKLEILERTVDYLRNIINRMQILEQGHCGKCSGSLQSDTCPGLSAAAEDGRPAKRKRTNYEHESEDEVESDGEEDFEEEPATYSRSLSPTQVHPPTEPSSRPSLPPISSWIDSEPASPVFQLPSPPQSVPFAPTHVANGALPGLVLPPAVNLPDGNSGHRAAGSEATSLPRVFPGGRQAEPVPGRRQSTDSLPHASPYPSPPIPPSSSRSTPNPLTISNLCHNDALDKQTRREPLHLPCAAPRQSWSDNDQTAVNLLLNFSSRSSTTSSDEKNADQEEHLHRENLKARELAQQRTWAHTPRSVLGMQEREAEYYRRN